MNTLTLLVEGNLDETVGQRIIEHAGFSVSTVYGRKGIAYIEKRISGFNQSVASNPMLVLADLMDTRLECPPAVVESWLPHRHKNLLLRIVVREVESWLLADGGNIADFLKIPESRLPGDPENLADPKRSLINLARRSRSASIRRLLVPAKGSTAVEGPGYTSEMQRFARYHWNVDNASRHAASLRSCLLAFPDQGSGF